MYDLKKDRLTVIGKAMAKYGSKDDAIFEMNAAIASLKADVAGKDTLLELARNNVDRVLNQLKSIEI